ncbi:hypothetical protein EDL98_01075 [Ornithobacterium rhinotracheale]|uniref:hypothetical protein n=1 Tax=Ornithobacterium rhinotracheale TaxID=28251 RepID=UPI00129C46AB|nr:hypothetical protein [Ornithobacterium rhinotracheale]MRJ09683.1 hypothetical protein [Ornithobacterium rhinotracheale]
MKKTLIILATLSLFSCKKEQEQGWTEKDRQEFMESCTAVDPSEETKERCKCGLKVLEEKYPTYQEAQNAAQKMDKNQLEELLKDCGL